MYANFQVSSTSGSTLEFSFLSEWGQKILMGDTAKSLNENNCVYVLKYSGIKYLSQITLQMLAIMVNPLNGTFLQIYKGNHLVKFHSKNELVYTFLYISDDQWKYTEVLSHTS